jgi:hypothetical protein
MNLLTWRQTPGLNAMVRIQLGEGDPAAVAAQVAEQLKAAPQGQRTLLVHTSRLAAAYPTNHVDACIFGPNYLPLRMWAFALFMELKRLGAQVDRVVTDDEANLNTWNMFAAPPDAADGDVVRLSKVKAVYAHPACREQWQTSRAFTPEEFVAPHWSSPAFLGSAATKAWDYEAERKQVALLDNVLFGPYRLIYNSNNCANYNHVNTIGSGMRDVTDKDGWPLVDVPVLVSSPVLYLWPGQMYRDRSKPWQWNALVNAANQLMACDPSKPILPWISYPSFSGDGVSEPRDVMLSYWSAMLRLTAAFCKDGILWNPASVQNIPDDDLYVLQSLPTLGKPASKASIVRAAVAYDADAITVAGMTIRFEDVMAKAA